MSFFKWLGSLFGGGGGVPGGDKRYLTIYALSRRCNEPVSGQVDLLNELSRSDEGDYAYYTRKVLHTSGERRCFSQVDISIYFNQDKQVINHEVEGGRWLTSEEYATELARFNAPPPEEEKADEGQTVARDDAPPASSASTTPDQPAANPPAANPPMPNQSTEENDHYDH
jgi:hypothetical protein